MKKTIFSLLLIAAGCLSASAQEVKTEEVFNPHWYLQLQGGAQHTLGEVSDVISPNVQLGVGYQFSPLWGLRLSVNAWQSKGGVTVGAKNVKGEQLYSDLYKWKWNYVAPMLDVTFDLTNAFGGFNPNRVVDVNLLAGVGANIGFNNGQAADAKKAINGNPTYNVNPDEVAYISKLWEGTKTRFVGRFGAMVDFRVSKRVSLGLEANANMIADGYNSKKSSNIDWYFNGLVGVKVALGKNTKVVPAPVPACDPVYVEKEKVVEKTIHDTVYVDRNLAPEVLRRDIFFVIRGSEVSTAEMPKVEDVAAYLNKYPNAKVTITGYADKGTGNAKVNVMYARNRAEMVSKLLQDKFGIAANRIVVDSKGDTEQPYEKNELNRVSICIAQ